jgi:hypothetical protein
MYLRSNKDASWTKEWGGFSRISSLFEALRPKPNHAVKTTTKEPIERVKGNNGTKNEGMLSYAIVEMVSSGFGGFCMRQIQGIILGAWRANGNLSS